MIARSVEVILGLADPPPLMSAVKNNVSKVGIGEGRSIGDKEFSESIIPKTRVSTLEEEWANRGKVENGGMPSKQVTGSIGDSLGLGQVRRRIKANRRIRKHE